MCLCASEVFDLALLTLLHLSLFVCLNIVVFVWLLFFLFVLTLILHINVFNHQFTFVHVSYCHLFLLILFC